MGLLNNRRNKADSEWTGFMEQGVELEGTFKFPGVFRVDGCVKGTIHSEHSLVLGENARVEGTIHGCRVSVAGRFDGEIIAKERVEILPRGAVSGEIQTPCLVIEPGGIFDGQCHVLEAAPGAKAITIPIRSASRVSN